MIKQAPTLDKKSKFGFLQLKREVTLADSFRLQILAALSLSLLFCAFSARVRWSHTLKRTEPLEVGFESSTLNLDSTRWPSVNTTVTFGPASKTRESR